MNADWRTSYGKCGADYGRCNPSHNRKFLYCDIANSECTDDTSVKTNNDYYDAYPEVACTSNDIFNYFIVEILIRCRKKIYETLINYSLIFK